MATLQGKAVKNTYRQVLQIGANNVGVSGVLQPVQDGGGVNTSLSLSTTAATITGTLTINGDLIITGGGIQIQDLIDDTVASLIQNGTGITWAYNDTLRTLTPTITIATADGGVQGDFVQYNTGAGEANAVAKMYWNTTDGTVHLGLMGGNVVLPIGQKQVARVLNNSGSILNKSAYQVVKITAAQGQRLAVGLAQANNDANSTDTIGLVAENIANNQEGFVTSSGLITGVDTTGDLQLEDWNDGDILYLSPTTPGAITKVKPVAPQHTVIVGFVVYAHKNNGKIYVKVDNGYELDELHNVKITSVANNNVLRYNSSLAVWENVAPITTWITEGTNLYYTQGRFDSAFAAKSTTNLAEGTNLYWTTARGNVNFATNLAASTTTNLAEGTNLYFTNQRFDSRFGTKTTTDLTEGTNLYYTQARFNTAFDAKTTTDLDEGTNLYYTNARARLALASSATGLTYANNSGVFSLTAGYAIPTTVKLGQYDIAYNRSIVSAAVTGTSTKTLSLTQQDANVITATWTDQGITTINGTANQIAATTVGNTTTLAFTNDVTMPNNLVVSGNLTINGTATYVNTQSISAKDPLFEVANDNNTTDAVDIGYYGRYYDSAQTRVEFTGLFRDASDAGKFKFFTGLVSEPTNVVDTTGTGYTVGTLVANFEGNLAGTANAANALTTARTIAASGDATWSVSFNGSANVTSALTLANTGVTATTYGTTTAVPTIAVDSKGRITSASNTNIAFPVTTVNGQAGTVVLTTTNIAEGSNQYFTSARAQASITGGASSVVTADLTASRALVSDGSGKITASASTTATEIGYVAGVTSAIQTQLNGKQATLTNPVTGTGTTNYLPKFTGASTIGNSLVFDNGTNVGIDTASPSYKLDVNGAGRFSGGFQTPVAIFERNGDYGQVITLGRKAVSSSAGIGYPSDATISLLTSGTARLTIDSGGAATFSSSVTAASAFIGPASNQVRITSQGTFASSTLNAHIINADGTGAYSSGDLLLQPRSSSGGGANNIVFGTSNNTNTVTERMRITSAGLVGIGTVNSFLAQLNVGRISAGATTRALSLYNNSSNVADTGVAIEFYPNTGNDDRCAKISSVNTTTVNNADLRFFTSNDAAPTERMRITSSGYLKASNNGSYSTGSAHELVNSAGGNYAAQFSNTHPTSPFGIQIYYPNTLNNTTNRFIDCEDNAALRFSARSNGGLANFQANDVNLSDERTKKDIIPLESYWDKFKAIEIVKFKYKDQTHDDFNIGVIAQQIESVAPEFVDIDGWDNKPKLDEDGNEIISDDEPLKSIYTADLYHATIKVLQEAMAKIEEQQAQIEELKALIAAK